MTTGSSFQRSTSSAYMDEPSSAATSPSRRSSCREARLDSFTPSQRRRRSSGVKPSHSENAVLVPFCGVAARARRASLKGTACWAM
ncbi:hypothetical protein ABZ943_02800 [Streptomyces rubiginosohelvolus]|uniref:hypothetical protein n=1 Tax=Streptomyces rubiginosohelvolus TaxID=67362 RepID=UPI0033E1E124